MMTLKPVSGPECSKEGECFIARTTCSPLGFCECDSRLFYDSDIRACVRIMEFNEPCDYAAGNECRNDHMICSDEGLCKCEPGFAHVPGWMPFCQPGNVTYCPVGQVWSEIRNMCVPRSVDVMFQPGAYDRNRYSLFFAVLLILLLMVILFKSKKPHPNPFPFGFTSQVSGVRTMATRNSCPDPYDPDILSIDELDIRLAEAGLYGDPEAQRQHRHQHHRIQTTGGGSQSYCVSYQPPPSYSSTLDLNRVDRREKPPSYEEAIRMPGTRSSVVVVPASQSLRHNSVTGDRERIPCNAISEAQELPACPQVLRPLSCLESEEASSSPTAADDVMSALEPDEKETRDPSLPPYDTSSSSSSAARA